MHMTKAELETQLKNVRAAKKMVENDLRLTDREIRRLTKERDFAREQANNRGDVIKHLSEKYLTWRYKEPQAE